MGTASVRIESSGSKTGHVTLGLHKTHPVVIRGLEHHTMVGGWARVVSQE